MSWTVAVTANSFWSQGEAERTQLAQAGCRMEWVQTQGPATREDELVAALQQADAVIATSDPYSREVLAALPRLKLVVRWGIGVDTVDLIAASDLGILVANVPGLTAPAVADLAWGMMLALARDLMGNQQRMRQGDWRRLPGVNVDGKVLGLVGFGRIGRAMARRAHGFDMTVFACDPYVAADEVHRAGAQPLPLDELLSRSDFVSLHAPHLPDTYHLIDEAGLRQMRPVAYLINTSRGTLVDEQALLTALREGWIAGAGLDVYEEEPLPADHPLRFMPNVVLTPHTASQTLETIQAVNAVIVESVLAAMRGEGVPYPVNPEVMESDRYRLSRD